MASLLSTPVNNFLKEFIKLNANTGTMIKNVKLVELHMTHATFFFNTQTLNMFKNFRYVINGTKRYKRRNMSLYL